MPISDAISAPRPAFGRALLLITAASLPAAAAPSPPPLVAAPLEQAAPAIRAVELLNGALVVLQELPSGRTHWSLLAARGTTLEIRRLGMDAGLSAYSSDENTINVNADRLEEVYAEMEAHGLFESAAIARHLAVKLAPTLAHEACHAGLRDHLASLAGTAVPRFLEEEAVCLYEELLVWRDLDEAGRWETDRTITDFDRLRDRIEPALEPRGGPLIKRLAEHFPLLLRAEDDRLKNLSLFYNESRVPPPSPLIAKQRRAETAMRRVNERIQKGGAGLLRFQQGLARLEEAVQEARPLSELRPSETDGSGKIFLDKNAYGRVRAFLLERVAWIEGRLSGERWRRWRERRYPGRLFVRAGSDAARLRWAVAAVRRSLHAAPDLLLEGNPYYFKTAKKLARKLDRDLTPLTREFMLLQEHRVKEFLADAERLAARPDDRSRRFAYRLLLRVETESRETWDLTPQWVIVREHKVIDLLHAAR